MKKFTLLSIPNQLKVFSKHNLDLFFSLLEGIYKRRVLTPLKCVSPPLEKGFQFILVKLLQSFPSTQ